MKSSESNVELKSFNDLAIAPFLLVALEKMNVTRPTSIQGQAIPVGLDGTDMIVVAQTGTGKTLAYALAILTVLAKKSDARALILAPSREVAEQVYRVLMALTSGTKILTCLVIGGIPNKQQVSQLKKKPQVIVATPGRMNDHLTTNKLLLQNTEIVVIDEADRMMDMGFAPQLESIRKTMRGSWQTWMFSASFGKSIELIAQKFMSHEPVLIRSQQAEMPLMSLTQKVVHLAHRNHKKDRLLMELNSIKGAVIVFAGNQPNCESAGFHLKENGVSSDFVHGGLNAGHRNRVLREFREGKIRVLVTTDLLARGLDVSDIEAVINFDLPNEPEDFLHRIGRTARAGQSGKAITFVTPADRDMYQEIQKYLKDVEEIRVD